MAPACPYPDGAGQLPRGLDTRGAVGVVKLKEALVPTGASFFDEREGCSTVGGNHQGMYRVAAVALVALAAIDHFYCSGWYLQAAGAIALNAIRLVTG